MNLKLNKNNKSHFVCISQWKINPFLRHALSYIKKQIQEILTKLLRMAHQNKIADRLKF